MNNVLMKATASMALTIQYETELSKIKAIQTKNQQLMSLVPYIECNNMTYHEEEILQLSNEILLANIDQVNKLPTEYKQKILARLL